MKLLAVRKDSKYLYIDTDQGKRQQSLKWSGVDALEAKCRSLINCEITHTTSGTWDPNTWFQDVTKVNTGLENNTTLNVPDAVTTFSTDLQFSTQTVQRIYGPPGTGKTTKLVQLTEEALTYGVDIKNIGYFTFTNIAANEALSRISEKLNINKHEFIGFSTLHSLATRIGGSLGKKLCGKDDLRKFDEGIGAREEWMKEGDLSSVVVRPDHPVLNAYSLKLNKISLEIEYKSSTTAVVEKLKNFFKLPDEAIQSDLLGYSKNYCQAYESFKIKNSLADFNDVIVNVVAGKFPDHRMPSFELLIIDEAQDLTNLQWKFVEKLTKKAKKTIIAGDDDQSIMEAFGASPQNFIGYPVTETDIVLEVSWRVPGEIKVFVNSKIIPKVIAQYPSRKEKEWRVKEGSEALGSITNSYSKISNSNGEKTEKKEALDINHLVRLVGKAPHEDWLIMAPTRATCEVISRGLTTLGVAHFLHRKDILNAETSRVKVQTVHTSKGMEATNAAYVVVSRGDLRMDQGDPRLGYVAFTRAKRNLYEVRTQ